MKKKAIVIAAVAVVLIAAIFLIFRDKPFNQQFRETTAGLTSYLLEGDMEITKGEDIKSYALSVKYLKEQEQDYFRVSLTDKDLNQEQEIIRNAADKAGHPLELRLQPGYDHSYYFIASFIEDHLRHHAGVLNG